MYDCLLETYSGILKLSILELKEGRIEKYELTDDNLIIKQVKRN